MRIPLAGFTFAAAMRMIDWVHNDTTDMRAFSLPSVASGFSYRNVLVIDISNLPDRRHARPQDPAHFPGLQANLDIIPVTAHHLCKASGTSNQLPALAELQLDIMNSCAQRHTGQRKRIPRTNFSLRS